MTLTTPIDCIVDDIDKKFLKRYFPPAHSLHPLLPPVKSNPHVLHPRDHNLQLPVCIATIFDVTFFIGKFTKAQMHKFFHTMKAQKRYYVSAAAVVIENRKPVYETAN